MVDARDKQFFFFLEPAGQDLHSFIPIKKEKKSALEVFKTPVDLAADDTQQFAQQPP